MSAPINCLNCQTPILDLRTSISMNKLNDVSNVWHVHKWCFLCVRCNVPLTMDNAALAEDTKEMLCLNHRSNKHLPENVCYYCGKNCDTDKVEDQGYFYHQACFNHCQSVETVIQNQEEVVDSAAVGDVSLAEVPDDFLLDLLSYNDDESPLNVDYLETQEREDLSQSKQSFSEELNYQEVKQPNSVTEWMSDEKQQAVHDQLELEPEKKPVSYGIFPQDNPAFWNPDPKNILNEFHPQYKQIKAEYSQEQVGGNQFSLPQHNFDYPMWQQQTASFYQQYHQQQQYLHYYQMAESGGLNQNSQQHYHQHVQNYLVPKFETNQPTVHFHPTPPVPLKEGQTIYPLGLQGPDQQNLQFYQVLESGRGHYVTIDKRLEHKAHQFLEYTKTGNPFAVAQKILDERAQQKIIKESPKVETKKPPASKVVKATKSSPPQITSNSVPRIRSTITADKKAVLARSFNISPFPSRKTRIELSKQTELDPRQVQIWFQNARSKLKKVG